MFAAPSYSLPTFLTSSQILVCNPFTTLEELQLIASRWAHAIAHGRADRLYVIANTHLLSYTLQSQAVALVSSVPPRECTTLVFVSGAEEGQVSFDEKTNSFAIYMVQSQTFVLRWVYRRE